MIRAHTSGSDPPTCIILTKPSVQPAPKPQSPLLSTFWSYYGAARLLLVSEDKKMRDITQDEKEEWNWSRQCKIIADSLEVLAGVMNEVFVFFLHLFIQIFFVITFEHFLSKENNFSFFFYNNNNKKGWRRSYANVSIIWCIFCGYIDSV